MYSSEARLRGTAHPLGHTCATGTWTLLSVGGDPSCVGRVGLSPACWGSNSQDQLGLGNLVSRNQPQTVS